MSNTSLKNTIISNVILPYLTANEVTASPPLSISNAYNPKNSVTNGSAWSTGQLQEDFGQHSASFASTFSSDIIAALKANPGLNPSNIPISTNQLASALVTPGAAGSAAINDSEKAVINAVIASDPTTQAFIQNADIENLQTVTSAVRDVVDSFNLRAAVDPVFAEAATDLLWSSLSPQAIGAMADLFNQNNAALYTLQGQILSGQVPATSSGISNFVANFEGNGGAHFLTSVQAATSAEGNLQFSTSHGEIYAQTDTGATLSVTLDGQTTQLASLPTRSPGTLGSSIASTSQLGFAVGCFDWSGITGNDLSIVLKGIGIDPNLDPVDFFTLLATAIQPSVGSGPTAQELIAANQNPASDDSILGTGPGAGLKSFLAIPTNIISVDLSSGANQLAIPGVESNNTPVRYVISNNNIDGSVQLMTVPISKYNAITKSDAGTLTFVDKNGNSAQIYLTGSGATSIIISKSPRDGSLSISSGGAWEPFNVSYNDAGAAVYQFVGSQVASTDGGGSPGSTLTVNQDGSATLTPGNSGYANAFAGKTFSNLAALGFYEQSIGYTATDAVAAPKDPIIGSFVGQDQIEATFGQNILPAGTINADVLLDGRVIAENKNGQISIVSNTPPGPINNAVENFSITDSSGNPITLSLTPSYALDGAAQGQMIYKVDGQTVALDFSLNPTSISGGSSFIVNSVNGTTISSNTNAELSALGINLGQLASLESGASGGFAAGLFGQGDPRSGISTNPVSGGVLLSHQDSAGNTYAVTFPASGANGAQSSNVVTVSVTTPSGFSIGGDNSSGAYQITSVNGTALTAGMSNALSGLGFHIPTSQDLLGTAGQLGQSFTQGSGGYPSLTTTNSAGQTVHADFSVDSDGNSIALVQRAYTIGDTPVTQVEAVGSFGTQTLGWLNSAGDPLTQGQISALTSAATQAGQTLDGPAGPNVTLSSANITTANGYSLYTYGNGLATLAITNPDGSISPHNVIGIGAVDSSGNQDIEFDDNTGVRTNSGTITANISYQNGLELIAPTDGSAPVAVITAPSGGGTAAGTASMPTDSASQADSVSASITSVLNQIQGAGSAIDTAIGLPLSPPSQATQNLEAEGNAALAIMTSLKNPTPQNIASAVVGVAGAIGTVEKDGALEGDASAAADALTIANVIEHPTVENAIGAVGSIADIPVIGAGISVANFVQDPTVSGGIGSALEVAAVIQPEIFGPIAIAYAIGSFIVSGAPTPPSSPFRSTPWSRSF